MLWAAIRRTARQTKARGGPGREKSIKLALAPVEISGIKFAFPKTRWGIETKRIENLVASLRIESSAG